MTINNTLKSRGEIKVSLLQKSSQVILLIEAVPSVEQGKGDVFCSCSPSLKILYATEARKMFIADLRSHKGTELNTSLTIEANQLL